MNSVQDHFGKPDPVEPYKPHSVEAVKADGRFQGLVLRVNIEGRDRRIALTIDALHDHGVSGPAAVEELRAIRDALEKIAEALTHNPETE